MKELIKLIQLLPEEQDLESWQKRALLEMLLRLFFELKENERLK